MEINNWTFLDSKGTKVLGKVYSPKGTREEVTFLSNTKDVYVMAEATTRDGKSLRVYGHQPSGTALVAMTLSE
jgi:hypothetical protein